MTTLKQESYKNTPRQFGDLPKYNQDHLTLYCSKKLLKHLDLKKECKLLNKEKRICRNITYNTLLVNMVLIVNYLSHIIPERNNSGTQNINTKSLKKVSNNKMYRVCIDILKKKKILYIKTIWDGNESYRVGEYSKAYRWNITHRWFEDDELEKIKVKDIRNIRKICKQIDILQCIKWLKNHTDKKVISIRGNSNNLKYKTPKNNIERQINHSWWVNAHNLNIFIHKGLTRMYENRSKYGLRMKILNVLKLNIDWRLYKRLSFHKLAELYDNIIEWSGIKSDRDYRDMCPQYILSCIRKNNKSLCKWFIAETGVRFT